MARAISDFFLGARPPPLLAQHQNADQAPFTPQGDRPRRAVVLRRVQRRADLMRRVESIDDIVQVGQDSAPALGYASGVPNSNDRDPKAVR